MDGSVVRAANNRSVGDAAERGSVLARRAFYFGIICTLSKESQRMKGGDGLDQEKVQSMEHFHRIEQRNAKACREELYCEDSKTVMVNSSVVGNCFGGLWSGRAADRAGWWCGTK